MNSNENFGAKVRVERNKKRMSQYKLADVVGLSRNNISNIELGDSDPKLSTVVVLASVLGISLDDLFELQVDKKGLSPDEFNLVHMFSHLNESHKEELLKIAEVFTQLETHK